MSGRGTTLAAVVVVTLALVVGASAWRWLREDRPERTLPVPDDVGDVTDAIARAVPDAQRAAKVPSVAVAVTDGSTVWSHTFGAADGTVFEAGSISKTVAAAAVLALAEDDVVDLDAPVAAYLHDWPLPDDFPDPDAVTLRRLLAHTAGIDTPGYLGLPADRPLPTTAESLDGATTGGRVRQATEVGSHVYSGGGYTILQQVVEEVTGEPFAAVVRRTVLAPLRMTASGYACTRRAATVDGEAVGHRDDGSPAPHYRYAEAAAAGLCSTAADLARFATWLGSDDPRARAMRSAAPGTDGHYGLGVEIDDSGVVGHLGVNRGFHAELRVDPATGLGLVVLTDGDRGGDVVDAVLRAWHGAA